jgi:hypothetical protein
LPSKLNCVLSKAGAEKGHTLYWSHDDGKGRHRCYGFVGYRTTGLAAGTKVSLFRDQRNESCLIGGQWGMY